MKILSKLIGFEHNYPEIFNFPDLTGNFRDHKNQVCHIFWANKAFGIHNQWKRGSST